MLRTVLNKVGRTGVNRERGVAWGEVCHGANIARMISSASVQPNINVAAAKPYSEIPGPKGLPFIGNIANLPRYIKSNNGQEVLMDNFKKWGRIYKEQVGTFKIVYLNDVNAVEKLHRHEGKYPRRIIIGAWRSWRDENKLSRGILTEDGADWKRMRAILDKQMLRMKHVATYSDNFNGVVTDFIDRLNKIKQTNEMKVPNMDHELFHFALETIGTVLYEVRLGCLSPNRPDEMTKFIQAVQDLFSTTSKVIYFPVSINRIIFSKWQKLHEHSWDVIFRTTQKLINLKYKDIADKLNKGEDVSGFLSSLCASDMPKDEVYGNISEIMLGAVDTTSNTMQWVLYELSKKQELQESLHAEITAAVPPGQLPSYETFQHTPLLKAIVKEVLRLYPVANVTTRILDEDIVLCGYHIPANVLCWDAFGGWHDVSHESSLGGWCDKALVEFYEKTTVLGSTYSLGRDPSIFPDPNEFKPERWLRGESAEAVHVHNFGWLPFGFGPRSCIGRRVAELEMHLLLARISQLFVLKPVEEKPLVPQLRGLLVPDRPVNVYFIDRKASQS